RLKMDSKSSTGSAFRVEEKRLRGIGDGTGGTRSPRVRATKSLRRKRLRTKRPHRNHPECFDRLFKSILRKSKPESRSFVGSLPNDPVFSSPNPLRDRRDEPKSELPLALAPENHFFRSFGIFLRESLGSPTADHLISRIWI